MSNPSSDRWWEGSHDAGPWEFPPGLAAYFEAEQNAGIMEQAQFDYIPGLLQTHDYIQALGHANGSSPQDTLLLTTSRDRRRMVLLDEERYFHFLIGEDVVTGDPLDAVEVVESQLQHLHRMNELDNVEISILPNHIRGESFTLLRGDHIPAPGVVLIEPGGGESDRFVTGDEEFFRRYRTRWQDYRFQSLRLSRYL